MPFCTSCGAEMEPHPSELCKICRFEQQKINEPIVGGIKATVVYPHGINPKNIKVAKACAYVGSIYAILGGIYTIIINTMYTDPYLYGLESVLVVVGFFQLIGSIISLIGAGMINNNPFGAKPVIITGSIIAGLNIITLIGGLQIKRE